jgi:hypothetical protein
MKRTSTKKWWLGAGCFGLFLAAGLIVVIALAFLIFPTGPANQASAIATAREWGRLAEIPATARILKSEATGSAFTRQIAVTFRDTPGNVRIWISSSPGPASATRSVDASGWTIYEYKAGGGALFAEVTVSPTGDEVRIRTFWN